MGIVQVVPTTGPDDPATKDLVMRIRAMEPHWQEKYGVPTAVTGFTAVAIDISDRLGAALLPFGILVVGISLLLLTMVFRSIAVPIKATIGYLLSVGAAFGATAMVFEYGWGSEFFNVAQTGPVISFLPILLMGILFGLAMDYELFLVSRIREEYVHGDSAKAAISDGFAASARVVVAAAIIMFSVFAAFVPEGEGPIKTIAFGLAVGVFVDAFIVRMTFVPAVLALLGRSAWWLPRWLDRALADLRRRGRGARSPAGPAGLAAARRRPARARGGLRVAGTDHELALAVGPRRGAPDRGPGELRQERAAADPRRPDEAARRADQDRRARAPAAELGRAPTDGHDRLHGVVEYGVVGYGVCCRVRD